MRSKHSVKDKGRQVQSHSGEMLRDSFGNEYGVPANIVLPVAPKVSCNKKEYFSDSEIKKRGYLLRDSFGNEYG